MGTEQRVPDFSIYANGSPQAQPEHDPSGAGVPDFSGYANPKGGDATAPTPAPANPGVLANAPDESWISGAAKGAGTAAIQGAADVPGVAGNMGGLVDYLLARGQSAITGRPVDDIMAEHAAMREAQKEHSRKTLGFAMPDAPSGDQLAAPVLAKTGQYEPETSLGRMGMMGARTAAGSALMGGTGSIPKAFVAGATGEGATEATGDPLVGLATGAVAPEIAGKVSSMALKPVQNYVAPMIPSARSGLASEMLGKAATNPQEALATANTSPAEIIPGSRPNLAEQTGDIGLAQATKAAGIADPRFAASQAASAGEQNAARASALNDIAPATGDVMSPTSFLNKQLSAIDDAHDNVIGHLSKQAESLNSTIPNSFDPEAVGTNLRTAIQGASDAAAEARSRLYKLVDPDNKLAVVTAPAREAAVGLQKSIDPSVSIPSSNAAPIIDMVSNLGDVTPFNKLSQLDSTITGAMAQAKRTGDYVGHDQLRQLKTAVMGSINNAVENQNAWEQRAIASGDLAPQDAMLAKMKAWTDNWYADRSAGQGLGQSYATGSGGDASGGQGSVSTARGTSGKAGSGFGSSQGNSGIQGTSGEPTPVSGIGSASNPAELQPNFDANAATKLAAAKQAHSEFAQTYRQAPVKPVLDTNGFAGQYRAASSTIPARAFPAGNTGYETTSAFLNAAAKAPEAVAAIQDMAMDRLRKGMKGADMLDPRALEAWKQNYGQALRAIDEASPGFSTKFDTVASATKALEDAQIAKVADLKTAQEGAAGKLMGATTPGEVKTRVGDMIRAKDGPTQIRNLLGRMGGDQGAVEGLQRAGAEQILDSVTNAGTIGGESVISGAKLKSLLTKNGDAIEALYGKEGVNNMRAIAADIERTQKALDNTRARSGSDTGANVFRKMQEIATKAGHISIGGAMAISGIEALHSGNLMGAAGIATAAGLRAGLGKLRANGIDSVNELYLRALENPEIGKAMLQTYINKQGSANVPAISRLGRIVERSSRMVTPLQQNAAPKREERKVGGRVGKSHEFLVNRLIKLADMAKKDQGLSTKPLLGAPDELVVKALKLTNQGI